MISRTYEVELPYGWESISWILAKPEKTLPFFPYFKEFKGEKVRFEVPRFIFKFGYEFTLDYGVQGNKAVYTFRGDRGILTITFEMKGRSLLVTASWSGFGEILMGKPLETFTRGIGEAIREFCSAAKCPVHMQERVENLTPELLVSLIKKTVLEVGRSFLLEGYSKDGSYFSIKVSNGILQELKIREDESESIVETEVPITALEKELLNGIPTGRSFRIRVYRD
ncbi:hypothetical protein [Thermococcus sp.]